MKLLYILLAILLLSAGGYFIVNNFHFNNETFSIFLIDTLFILLPFALLAAAIGVFFGLKRKHTEKEVMTIRQYYDYKSAR